MKEIVVKKLIHTDSTREYERESRDEKGWDEQGKCVYGIQSILVC